MEVPRPAPMARRPLMAPTPMEEDRPSPMAGGTLMAVAMEGSSLMVAAPLSHMGGDLMGVDPLSLMAEGTSRTQR